MSGIFPTIKDLETPRPAREIFDWVVTRLESIPDTDTNNSAIRMCKGTLKNLIEELLPIGVFGKHHSGFNDSAMLKPHTGNENFDCEVLQNGNSVPELRYLEVTQAHEGKDAHWRMCALEQNGRAAALGKPIRTKKRNQGFVFGTELIARPRSEILATIESLIDHALTKKSKKGYRPQTALVIAFDDRFLRADLGEFDTLEKWFAEKIRAVSNFSLVALVGNSGNYFAEWRLK